MPATRTPASSSQRSGRSRILGILGTLANTWIPIQLGWVTTAAPRPAIRATSSRSR